MVDAAEGGDVEDTWKHDPVLALLLPEFAAGGGSRFRIGGAQAAKAAVSGDPVKAMSLVFEGTLVRADIVPEAERRLVALKLGFPRMPATTARIVLQGFGDDMPHEDVLDVFASHGLSLAMRRLSHERDFVEINRRAAGWGLALAEAGGARAKMISERFAAIAAWLRARRGGRAKAIDSMMPGRGLFFHWWDCFRRLGLLGLADPGPELFRGSKIGPGAEARIVVDRLQHRERSGAFYVKRLASQGVEVRRDAVAKVLARWGVGGWNCRFTSNLSRLESEEPGGRDDQESEPAASAPRRRLVERKFLYLLDGWRSHPATLSAPGLPALWAYLDELAIVPELERMGLAEPVGKDRYSWLELLMFDIARRFHGVATAGAACESGFAELAWFARLYAPPCDDTLLDGLAKMSEAQAAGLRKWLVDRLAQLGLSDGRRIAFDFHQIDLDAQLARLRGFGKGPSPKKKLCWEGFRPHIAWDVENGTLLAAEFRKGSARGTTTVRRFASDNLMPTFQGLFEEVYIDSEYTGTDVWSFILSEDGMGAALTACLRQNSLVRRLRDKFLARSDGKPGFWRHYDDDHCFSSETFPIQWEITTPKGGARRLRLACVVKKNIHTGSLRCFGSSKPRTGSEDILRDYSSRWTVENGIKDLVASYFLDKCPGMRPHAVDTHFLITTICRSIYRMVERDIGEDLVNPDGTVMTLDRMRDTLFRQGSATLDNTGDSLRVTLLNPYRVRQSSLLRRWFAKIAERHAAGLGILGGMRLEFLLQPPRGKEYRNSGKRGEIPAPKKSGGGGKNTT
jgi:hypothetical protein